MEIKTDKQTAGSGHKLQQNLRSSLVEHLPDKKNVAGSTPVVFLPQA